MLIWSAGLQSRAFQPMVRRWDPPRAAQNNLQSFWPTVPSGLLAFDDEWPIFPEIRASLQNILRRLEVKKSPSQCEEQALREGEEVWGEPLKEHRKTKN